VYHVLKQMGNLPVCTVSPEDGDGPDRTLHRDLLLPCGHLSETDDESAPERLKPPKRPSTRQNSPQLQQSECSDSEDEYVGFQVDPHVHTETFIRVYDTNRYLEPLMVSDVQIELETSNMPLPPTVGDPQIMPDEVIEAGPDTDRVEARHDSDNAVEPPIDDMPMLSVEDVDDDHSNTDLPDQRTVEKTEIVTTYSEDTDIRKSNRIK